MTPEDAEKTIALLDERRRQVDLYWDYIHSRYGKVTETPGWYEQGGTLPLSGAP